MLTYNGRPDGQFLNILHQTLDELLAGFTARHGDVIHYSPGKRGGGSYLFADGSLWGLVPAGRETVAVRPLRAPTAGACEVWTPRKPEVAQPEPEAGRRRYRSRSLLANLQIAA